MTPFVTPEVQRSLNARSRPGSATLRPRGMRSSPAAQASFLPIRRPAILRHDTFADPEPDSPRDGAADARRRAGDGLRAARKLRRGWSQGDFSNQVLRPNSPVVSSSGKPRARNRSRSRRIVFAPTPASAAISRIVRPCRRFVVCYWSFVICYWSFVIGPLTVVGLCRPARPFSSTWAD